MLRLHQVCKSFFDPGRGEVRAVDSLSLELSPGVIALVGANGAGKSTLLRLIATLLTPDSGTIHLGDLDSRHHPDQLRQRLGYLSTTTRLYPRFTPAELLAQVASFFPLSPQQQRERIDAMVQAFDLHDILHQRIQGLSTGQLQRANLARTLLGDPDILILDEPTTGLDLVAADQLVQAVNLSRRPGRLIIIATHVMREVQILADRLIVLHQGRVVFDDVPTSVGDGDALTRHILTLLRPEQVIV